VAELVDEYVSLGNRCEMAFQIRRVLDLTVFFDEASFDLVHCSNALDHSFDPLRGLREIVHITKVGGLVHMLHHENEAVMEDYGGMHQHNFTVRDGRFVIWNREGEVDVADALGLAVEIEAHIHGETLSAHVKRGVAVTIRKVAPVAMHTCADRHRQRLAQMLAAIVGTFAERIGVDPGSERTRS
jgi:SAM-dependent methyltransferase